ncbi:MAG: AraC family transcriptional regulator [Spirochaetes bacterium]|nr:AraC family transcriptional regulator [Spirochaetota bacterium]
MDLFKTVNFIGAVQGMAVFLILAFSGKTRRMPNLLLSAAVFLLSLNLLLDYFFHRNVPIMYVKDTFFHILIAFACGPFIYLYVRSIAGSYPPAARKIISYFAPFMLASLFVLVCAWKPFGPVLYRYYFLAELSSLLCFLVFLVFSIAAVYRYERSIRDAYSNIEKMSLRWLQFLVYSMAIILLFAAALYLMGRDFKLIWILLSLLMYVIGYFTLRRPEILLGEMGKNRSDKYATSPLTADFISKSRRAIDTIMEEEKVYLNSEITLPVLAGKLAMPVHHLSQVINQAYHKNFFEFISHHRIMAAREMLSSPVGGDQRIVDVCYRVGFNTVSAFNKSFKKITGLTPTQFRNRNCRIP